MAKEPAKKTSLTDRLMAAGKIKNTAILSESIFFTEADMVQTNIPMMNVALSGSLRGGFVPGITTWAGPSKHFKTLFGLIQAAAYLLKYPDAKLLLYDSEFGSPLSYFASVGIDPDRVIHVPILSIEELRTEMSLHLEEIQRGDHIIVMIDSIGNLASTKEIEDAKSGSDKADMTRAKVLKSLFRIITPHFKSKNINLIVINHTYQTMEMYAKTVVGGGTGNVYATDNLFVLGKQANRETAGADKGDLLGYHFVINIDKSRFAKEKSKILITVNMDGGIQVYSGLFELALEAQMLVEVGKGKYEKVDPETGEYNQEGKGVTERVLNKDVDFWESLLESDKFNKWVESQYQLGSSPLMAAKTEEDA